jgi:hypothetical protein
MQYMSKIISVHIQCIFFFSAGAVTPMVMTPPLAPFLSTEPAAFVFWPFLTGYPATSPAPNTAFLSSPDFSLLLAQ